MVGRKAEKGRDEMRLGKLIQLLENEPQANPLALYGPGNPCLYPTDCASYRGCYDELAIEFVASGKHDDSPVIVSVFLTILKEVVGKTFTGYKGGDYVMTEYTKVWLANYSYSGGFAVTGVQSDWSTTYLTFQREED